MRNYKLSFDPQFQTLIRGPNTRHNRNCNPEPKPETTLQVQHSS